MIIGYGISHDCGIAVVDEKDGTPFFAASYERMNRIKNQGGDPSDLLSWFFQSRKESEGIKILPISDNLIFQSQNGFYALESGLVGDYRWISAEALIGLNDLKKPHSVFIQTFPQYICKRRFIARLLVDNQELGIIDNRVKSLFIFPIPEGCSAVDRVVIRATKTFKNTPDPRDLGIIVKSVGLIYDKTSWDNIHFALSEIEVEHQLVRLLKKQFFVLPINGLRSHKSCRLKELMKFHLGIIISGKRTSSEQIIKTPLMRKRSRFDHHWCHAASAYYPSGFDKALVVSLDGMGDYYSSRILRGEQGKLHNLKSYFYEEAPFALNYEIVTAMLGFNVLRHAGKITGLAAYGKDNPDCDEALNDLYTEMWKTGSRKSYNYDDYLRSHEDGIKRLTDMREKRFGQFSREDIAYALQKRTEHQVCDFIGKWKDAHPDLHNIALAGGIFGNVKLNQRIKEMGFKRIFIQPAMSDAGLCFGAALLEAANQNGGRLEPFQLKHVFLGFQFSDEECREALESQNLPFKYYNDKEICEVVARFITEKKVVAHYYGKMEFGPRALGNRSILYSASDPTVNTWLNKQLKRTEFMPFAPAVLCEYASDYFLNIQGAEHAAEFMTITFDCAKKAREDIPAAIHVDNTARPQLVHKDHNPRFYNIISEYYKISGIPALINTSFNMHEEPIVATPYDAIRAFKQGGLDVLVLGNYVIG